MSSVLIKTFVFQHVCQLFYQPELVSMHFTCYEPPVTNSLCSVTIVAANSEKLFPWGAHIN
jgi:hypothetical protein